MKFIPDCFRISRPASTFVPSNRKIIGIFTPNFFAAANLPQKVNDTKLRPEDIAYAVKTALEMDDRGFIPELSVFATNPVD